MLHTPTVFREDALVSELASYLEGEHVHAALVVDAAGHLISVVDPVDLSGRRPSDPAQLVGRLTERVLCPADDLERAWHMMVATGRRRLAVVDSTGKLLGLLCLKRSLRGFCSDADVSSRRLAARRGDD